MCDDAGFPGEKGVADAFVQEEAAPEGLYSHPRWYACYTRARHEKQVETQLLQKGIESYLPVVPQLRQWKDRKKLVQWPLFPSYVFARFTLRDVHDVLVVPGVATVVRVDGYPTPIPDEELENVRRLAGAAGEAGIQPELRPLVQEGEWVRVTDGPFRGVEGIVVEQRGRRRVLVGLAVVGQGMEIDIDTRVLRVIPAPTWAGKTDLRAAR